MTETERREDALSADEAWEWYRAIIVRRMEAPPREWWRWRTAARDAKEAFVQAMGGAGGENTPG